MPAPTHPSDLITLQQASALLGVHPSTLRLWADQGKLKAFRTAGGHRRFSRREVQRLAAGLSDAPSMNDAQLIMQSALGRARMEVTSGGLTTQNWYQLYDEATREHHREMGRQLLGLMMHYLNAREERPQVLNQARRAGSAMSMARLRPSKDSRLAKRCAPSCSFAIRCWRA